MALNAVSIESDTTVRLKQLVASGTGYTVYSSYPDQKTPYPYVTIKTHLGNAVRLGAWVQNMKVPITAEVKVWSLSTMQADQMAGSVFYTFVNNQTNSASGTEAFGLYDMQLVRAGNVDEPGKQGVHQKVMEFAYFTTI